MRRYDVATGRHGFTQKKNQIEGYGAILRFLDKHLKGAPAARAAKD